MGHVDENVKYPAANSLVSNKVTRTEKNKDEWAKLLQRYRLGASRTATAVR